TEPANQPDTKIDLARTLVTVGRPLLFAGDTVPVTLQTRNAAGQPLTAGGATVVLSTQGGTSGGTFLSVVDRHDGTYSADFAGETMGTAITIASGVEGEGVGSTPPPLRVRGRHRVLAAGATGLPAQPPAATSAAKLRRTGTLRAAGMGVSTAACAPTIATAALCRRGGPWGRLGTGARRLGPVPMCVNAALAFAALRPGYRG